MGVGDWLMATGEVRLMYERRRLPVMIVDRFQRPVWNPIFDNNPKIIRDLRGVPRHQRYVNGTGCRPYIAEKTVAKWTWRKYGPPRGEIYFTDAEREFAEPFRGSVLFEPNVKDVGHRNKAWLYDRWQALIDLQLADAVQVGPPSTRFLGNLRPVETATFRLAAAVLSVCRAFVGTEGGLMHAAAAVGTPAIILWSEFIHPSITGYPQHVNIRHASQTCGRRTDCPTCRESMHKITVEEVAKALKSTLEKGKPILERSKVELTSCYS